MNVDVIAILNCKKDAEATFLMEVKKLLEASQTEDGCLAYHLYESKNEDGQYVITERWCDEDAFCRHQESPHYKYFVHISPALLSSPVDIKALNRLV